MKQCTDHLGNMYGSLKNMCEHYDIKVQTFSYRIKSGYTLEEALTSSTNSFWRKSIKSSTDDDRYVQDHKGNKYMSVRDMCKSYNVEPYVFYKRTNRGWSVETALTTKVKKRNYNRSIKF